VPLIQPVILTVPGQRHAWVAALVRHFCDQAGFCRPLVHADAAAAGAARATQQAIEAAIRRAPGAPVLLLEDDVQADPEALEAIRQARFGDHVGVISFCDMREVEEYAPDGLYERSALGSDGRGWWGNQALLMHPDTAAALAAADSRALISGDPSGVVVHRVTYNDAGRNCADIRLALIVHRQPQRNRFAVHVPSVFLHLGQDSLCFPGRSMGERATRNWIAQRRRYDIC